MRRRKAWVELDRFLELGRRALASAGPHANQGKREVSVRVANIERYRALSELEGLEESPLEEEPSEEDFSDAAAVSRWRLRVP